MLKIVLKFILKNKNILLFAVFLTFLCIDQIAKHLVMQVSLASPNFIYPLLPFFNIVFVLNDGVSFGIFANSGAKNYLIITASFLCLLILYFLYKEQKFANKFAFCLILCGAVGNLIDRIIYGAVIDFLDFYIKTSNTTYQQYHWPAFNVADSLIFVGVCTLLFYDFLRKKIILK